MGEAEGTSPTIGVQARPRVEFRQRLKRAGYVPLLVMVFLAVLTGAAVNQLLERAQWVDHTHSVIAQANRCFVLAVDLQSGVRGYQLTGATNFLTPYLSAKISIDPELRRLREMVADNPAQVALAVELADSVDRFIDFAETIVARRARGDDVLNLALNDDSLNQVRHLRELFQRFISAEEALIEPRTTAFSHFTNTLLTGRFAVAFLAAVLLSLFIGRQLASLSRSYETALDEVAVNVRRASEEAAARLETERLNEHLKEVDRLKSQFLATMSHELRTPLNSIIGFSEIIAAGLAGPINEEQKKQLGMVLNSARHLLQLINDLLDVARIESGRFEVVRETFALAEIVERVVNTLRPAASKKQLPIVTDVKPGLCLESDRKMVFQVLLNLANNAVKFTERGQVRIEASAADGTVELRVSDSGIGIKSENVGLLFEAFRQVDGSARRRFEGTGLGLYLSKRLVTLLGGEITVHSVFEQGSTFVVRLPVRGGTESA